MGRSQGHGVGSSRCLRLLVLATVVAAALRGAEGRIEKSVIKNDERDLVPVSAPFGFNPHGVMKITLSEMSMLVQAGGRRSDIDLNKIGFFLSKMSGGYEASGAPGPSEEDESAIRDTYSYGTCPLTAADEGAMSAFAGTEVLFTWDNVEEAMNKDKDASAGANGENDGGDDGSSDDAGSGGDDGSGDVGDNQAIQRKRKMGYAARFDPKFVYIYEKDFKGNTYTGDGESGLYTLYFANCNQGNAMSYKYATSSDTCNLTIVEMYNLSGDKKNYLSAGEIPLPYMYLSFFFLYLIMIGAWAFEVYVKEKNTAKRIHSFMCLLLVFKALTLLSQSGMYFLIKSHGDPEGWRYVYYAFSFARGLMLFTVIVLVGTGYNFIKPFLAPREKRIIMIVVPLQVISDIAQIVLNEETPITRGYFAWNDLFHLVDIICCCAVLFPIVWSIKHHREAASIDGKAARNVMKLVLFRQFYVMVVAYIYFTRIIVELLRSMQSYDQMWISDFMNELATVAFYCVTGWKFRPMGDNPYFSLQEGDLSEEEMRDLIDGL